MCGRYSITQPVDALARIYGFLERLNLPPRYNAAPTQELPVVRAGADGRRHLVLLRWGLIPSWAEDAAIGSRLINARAETVATKPAFRDSFRRRRCLVPADGFYEWQAVPGARTKRPWRIHPADGGPFAFAGLWARWEGADGTAESFTILTTEADAVVAPIHRRMPVILAPETFAAWLSPATGPAAAQALLAAAPPPRLTAYPVRPIVNSPANDIPDCLAPAEEAPTMAGPDRPRQGNLFE